MYGIDSEPAKMFVFENALGVHVPEQSAQDQRAETTELSNLSFGFRETSTIRHARTPPFAPPGLLCRPPRNTACLDGVE